MKNRLIIIGAGGHGKVIVDNAMKNGYTHIAFLDDAVTGTYMERPVLGKLTDINTFNDGKTDFIIAIGCNETRCKIAKEYAVNYVSLIHPSAQIAWNAEINAGTMVMAGAIVNAGAKVGKHCIINSGSIIEHDNRIGDFVHISPRVALGGTVRIDDFTHMGIGSVVSNNISICKDVVVGAGAVVVKNIEKAGVYIGVPAKAVL